VVLDEQGLAAGFAFAVKLRVTPCQASLVMSESVGCKLDAAHLAAFIRGIPGAAFRSASCAVNLHR